MGVLVPPAIRDDSSLIAVKSTQQVPEDLSVGILLGLVIRVSLAVSALVISG